MLMMKKNKNKNKKRKKKKERKKSRVGAERDKMSGQINRKAEIEGEKAHDRKIHKSRNGDEIDIIIER